MRIKSLDTLVRENEKKERLVELHTEVAKYAKVREEVFAQMLERGKPEYKWFILGIRAFKILSRSSPRGQFLENYYIAMRYVDDITDGDITLPAGYSSSAEYVQRKLAYVKSKFREPPADDCERLLALAFKLAREFDSDFGQETEDILNSLEFDAKRRGTHQIFPATELNNHFFMLDIRGAISGGLKVFGENPDNYEILQPLGEADRIYYNLKHFKEDIKAGFVNISAEDCARLGITTDVLESGEYANHQGLQTWFKEQAGKGLALIGEYHRKRQGVTFQPVTKLALKLAFETKAKMFLQSVAQGNFAKIFER